HGDSQLVNVVVGSGAESGARLPFRTAMDVDDHRTLAGELRIGRLIQVSRNGTAVKGLPVDQFRRDELCRIQSAGLAVGPALKLVRLRVKGIAVERRFCRAEAEGNIASILMPLQ